VPDGRIAVLGRHRIAFCPQEEKNYDAGQRNFLIDEFRLSASNALNTP
jgi:hypothetical protein